MIDDQVRAPWFAHLHHTAVGSGTLSGPARCLPGARRFLAFVPPSHVASVALPMAPTPAELALACELGTLLLQHRVFVVMTTSSRAAGVLAQLGQACDCIVTGDGGAMHHQYPLRTMMEPASGRLICYGLYDACILWAGRLGEYAAPDMTTAALLHVEIPATVPTLIEIDALITPIRDGLDDPGALRLASIVEGGLVDLAKISFRTDRLIRQDRAELPPESQPTPMSGQTWS